MSPPGDQALMGEGRFFLDGGAPVLGNVTSGIDTFTSPQAMITYITLVIVQFVGSNLIWVPLHLLFWDESTATSEDRLTLAVVREELSNLGHIVFFIIFFFFLLPTAIIVFTLPRIILARNPTLLTRRRRHADETDAEARLFHTIAQADFVKAFRSLISPAGMGRVLIFNTLLSTSFLVILVVAPLLTPKAWSFLGRKRRKRENYSVDKDFPFDKDTSVEQDLPYDKDSSVERDSPVLNAAKFAQQMIQAAEIKYSGGGSRAQ